MAISADFLVATDSPCTRPEGDRGTSAPRGEFICISGDGPRSPRGGAPEQYVLRPNEVDSGRRSRSSRSHESLLVRHTGLLVHRGWPSRPFGAGRRIIRACPLPPAEGPTRKSELTGQPRVDEFNACAGEVLRIPCRQGCVIGPADRRDLSVEAADRRPPAVASVDNLRVDRGCGSIEGEDIFGEPAEHVHRSVPQRVVPPAAREPFDPGEDFGHRDRRDAQFVWTSCHHPGSNCR